MAPCSTPEIALGLWKLTRKLVRIIESGTRVDKSCRLQMGNGVGTGFEACR